MRIRYLLRVCFREDLSEDRSFIYIDVNFCTCLLHSFTIPRYIVRYLNFCGLSVPPSPVSKLITRDIIESDKGEK